MKEMNKHSPQRRAGYTLLELLVTLSILSLLTVTLVGTGFNGHTAFSDTAYEAECEKILYALLQYQNEAIMDGYRRQVRFLDDNMRVVWTKNGLSRVETIDVKTLRFTGSYSGATTLNLYGHGTVSQGGTVNLTSLTGRVKRIVVQVGNGRIYLDEP